MCSHAVFTEARRGWTPLCAGPSPVSYHLLPTAALWRRYEVTLPFYIVSIRTLRLTDITPQAQWHAAAKWQRPNSNPQAPHFSLQSTPPRLGCWAYFFIPQEGIPFFNQCVLPMAFESVRSAKIFSAKFQGKIIYWFVPHMMFFLFDLRHKNNPSCLQAQFWVLSCSLLRAAGFGNLRVLLWEIGLFKARPVPGSSQEKEPCCLPPCLCSVS